MTPLPASAPTIEMSGAVPFQIVVGTEPQVLPLAERQVVG